MKDYLNRTEYDDGTIKIKMVKMGMDIDNETNHRIRGIVPTEDNKYLFVELISGSRIDRKYLSNIDKKQYEEKYPYENYIFCDFCFRVDVPKDYYDNYTSEFINIGKHAFYDMNYDKDTILNFFQKLNKNIKEIELVDYNYIDEYENKNGFYRLYDDRLDHKYTPIKVNFKNDKDLSFDVNYECKNYDDSIEYSEMMTIRMNNYDLEILKKEFGESIVDLFEEYDKSMEKIIHDRNDVEIEM